mgnify:CR=1 FL=1
MRYLSLKKSVVELAEQSVQLQTEHLALETRVAKLRAGSIDRDLLEERARIVLGYRHVGEKDIITE